MTTRPARRATAASVTPHRAALAARVWLLLLVLLACALGSNQPLPPGSTGQVPDDPGALTISCPAYDPSVFPPDLAVSSTTATLLTTPGAFAVSRTGEATYSIPLVVPPGRAGMEPSLAIAYGSSAGEGLLGVGFGLQGLSAVTRCPANQAQDGFLRPVRYDEQDPLCLDGARLVQVAEQLAFDGTSTREYRTFPDSFTKVVGHFAPGLGPQSFEAYTRAGRIREYGGSADSRAMAKSQVVAAWWLSRERDRHDEAVVYVYGNDRDPKDGHTLEITPARIAYAYQADHKPSREVVLVPATSKAPSVYYSGGMKLRRSRRLAEVRMITQPGEAVVRSYHLAYKPGEGTGRTLLQAVKECAGESGPCKPETSFAWSSHASGGFQKVDLPRMFPAGNHDYSRSLWLVADVNGDGLDDLVFSTPSWDDSSLNDWMVSLNEGGSFGVPKLWFRFPYPDDNYVWKWTPSAMDYDQDGRTDIILDAPNMSSSTYLWLKANPDHSFTLKDTGAAHPVAVDWGSKDIPMKAEHHRFMRLGDVNGDGMADLIECVSGVFEVPAGENPDFTKALPRWTVRLWSPTGDGAGTGPGFDTSPIPIPRFEGFDCAVGIKELYLADVNGDGAADLLTPDLAWDCGCGPNGSTPDCWCAPPYVALRYTGAGWEEQDAGSLPGQRSWRKLHFFDMNGDGLPDVLYTAFSVTDPEPIQFPFPYGCPWGGPVFFDCSPHLFTADWDMDGHTEGHAKWFEGTEKWMADIPVLALNHGKGYGFPTPILPDTASIDDWLDRYGDSAVPLDYNGDGKMDLIMPMGQHCGDPGNTDPCWVVMQAPATGADYFSLIDTFIPYEPVWDAKWIDWWDPKVTDVDGDGRHDLIVPDQGEPGKFYLYKNDGPQDLLLSISDATNPLAPADAGFVPSVAIRYGNLVDQGITQGIAPTALHHDDLTYVAQEDPSNDCTYPRACVKGTERVVRSYTVNNGQNETRQFYLKYRDGRYHRLGRGFLGFGERILIDGDTAAGSVELYDNITYDPNFDAFPFAGQVVRSWAWSATRPHWLDPGQVEMTFTTRTLEQVPTNQGSTFFTMPVGTSVTREEGTMQPGSGKSVLRFVKAAEVVPVTVLGASSSAVLAHDDFGNVLYASSDAEGVDLHDTVSRTYDNDPATWLIGKMKTEEACSTSLARTQCRSSALDYDARGEVKSAVVGDPTDPGTLLTLGFWRDAFGQVTLTTADDAFGHQRTSCVTYDADHLFPHATGDALGHVSYTRFDPAFGVITAAVDANGLPTQWRRDIFGSVTEELRADGTRTTVEIARTKDGGPQGKWFNAKITTKEDGGALRTTELDALGRPVHSWTVAAEVQSCGATLCRPVLQLEQETQYDWLGRVSRATLPWMSDDALQGKAFHAYHYDASGRMTRHTEPWGRVTTFAYGGHLASSTDWLGTTTMEVDGLGRPVKVTDKKGYATETTYGPFGATWAVERTGAEITWSERDAYGRVIREVDPDRGETDLAYDGFGEAITTDDALGRHAAFTYDALGRLVQRDDPDGTVRWEYDTAAHGIGKIAGVTSPLSVKQYAYDALSRPEMIALTLTDTGDRVQAGFGYDGLGRLQVIAYPQVTGVAPLVLRRVYDAYGQLVAVRDNGSGTPYWQLQGLDGAGRTAIEKLGSGVTARHDYDPYTGLVQRIRAGTRDAPPLEDLAYTYDKGLRMASRADRLQVSPQGVRTEVFAHDALGRLTCGAFVDLPPGHKLPAHLRSCDTSLTYDPSGNITGKGDVGPYTYDPAHPHAVQTAGAGSYGYDAVGNQITRPDAGITYTAFDLPKVVTPTAGDPPVHFTYDGDQQRIRKRSNAQETLYFEDMYERVGGGASGGAVHRYYVAAGSAMVVLTRHAGGSGKVAYLHTDALGSTDVVTDGNGEVAGSAGERRSYDAFGARRNPAWGKAATGAFTSKASPMGFTGHEGDDELGLINMRGRIYDPRLGRFLSTDPVVSRPHFGQSWNPYSYVLNSPLNFVDPSGFDGVGIYRNSGGVEGQFPVADVRMPADPSSGAAPAVTSPSGSTNPSWEPHGARTRTKDAAVDDNPQGSAAGVAQPAPRASADERPRYEDRTPVLPFFISGPWHQYVRRSQDPGAGAPNGLDALRRLNGGAPLAVAEFSRDIAPGTSIQNLTLLTVDALGGAVSVGGASGRVASRVAAIAEETAVAEGAAVVASKRCFPAGTPVLTPDGLVSIEKIRAGDRVLAFDQQTGDVVTRQVNETFENVTDRLVEITYEGGELVATMSHPFWVLDAGWVAAKDITAGMRLRTPHATVAVLRTYTSRSYHVVYSFSVAETRNYFAGRLPVLVHNTDPPPLSNYNEAVESAFEWLRGQGVDSSALTEFHAGRLGGKGMATPGARAGFRIEWDPRSGAHINAWAHKEKSPHFKFPGNQKSVDSLLKVLFCK